MRIDIIIDPSEREHLAELAKALVPGAEGEPEEIVQMWVAREIRRELRVIQKSKAMREAALVADEAPLPVAVNSEEWAPDVRYDADAPVTYQGSEYSSRVAHTSMAIYPPDLIPAIWRLVRDNSSPQPWVQPEGAHDTFDVDDRVTHNAHTWRNTVPNNSWEPGVYGWEIEDE